MAYSVNWEAGIITIPQADLVYLSPNTYKLDLYVFMKECLRLTWDEGLSYDEIITYYPTVDTGDVLLGKSILLNYWDYSIYFEDLPIRYAVKLDGGNTNIHNYSAITNGIPYPNNSAGLQDLSILLAMAYMDRVVLDVVKGQKGTTSPIGTLAKPSSNTVDAVSIAHTNGISKILTIRDLILGEGDDISGLLILGIDSGITSINITPEAVCDEARFQDIYVVGTMDGKSSLDYCNTGDIDYFDGTINNSGLAGRITLSGTDSANFHRCSVADFHSLPSIVYSGSNHQDVIMTEWTGRITFENSVNSENKIGVGMMGGHVIIDSSCIEGHFTISGDGTYENNGGANVIVDATGLNNPQAIAKAVANIDMSCP